MKTELNILIEALVKKEELLIAILADSKKQLEIVSKSNLDTESFDELVDHKANLLLSMEKVDEGFDMVYNKIKNKLLENRESYKLEICQLQNLIRETMDTGAEIHRTETDVKRLLTSVLNSSRKHLQKEKAESKAVFHYYKQANQMNFVDPAFMDQKK